MEANSFGTWLSEFVKYVQDKYVEYVVSMSYGKRSNADR